MNKFSYYALGLLLGFILMVVWQMPNNKTKIIACEVGQGDAILISKGRNQVLIDGGPSSGKILTCLRKHIPFWDRQIELIVLTNTDYDHMNGLSSVVERYSLGEFVTADGVQISDSLNKLRDQLVDKKVLVKAVMMGDVIQVGGEDRLTLQVLWPPDVKAEYVAVLSTQIGNTQREQILGESANRGEQNERSVVLMLTEGSYRALFTGDSGFQIEKTLMERSLLSKVDYLKVAHHGSKYSTSQEFLQRLRPTVAVISVGKGNKYGHPTTDTLKRLKDIGAKILRTDEIGDVEVIIP